MNRADLPYLPKGYFFTVEWEPSPRYVGDDRGYFVVDIRKGRRFWSRQVATGKSHIDELKPWMARYAAEDAIDNWGLRLLVGSLEGVYQ